jgi:predicted ATPase/transcriptional regulator with XRE-family HTH domain
MVGATGDLYNVVFFRWNGCQYPVHFTGQKVAQIVTVIRKLPLELTHVETSFGTWIKRRRKALDMTQPELAQRVGCSASLIFKIESDARRPSRQIAELLAEHLKIPLDQRALFLKVARQEKTIDHLEPVSPLSSPGSDTPSNPFQPNLPLPLTSLIGREHELRMLLQQIQDPTCRLLTLTGPGGVGKTRLALEVVHQLPGTFKNGACFVSLAGTSASEFIIPAIADTLGLSFSGTIELKAQLFNFLKEKQILLVLDNLEHLLNGIELLDELLEYAPSLKLLTTSREKLNLRTEWAFEVQGLPTPSSIEMDGIESNSAVALFLQRAKQVNVNFTPTPEDLHAVARICQLVEGLPLGLELAATWANTLSCPEIAVEIERGLDFLTTSKRDIPERHRSIQAVFEYSWNLLSIEEQAALKNLSVLQGRFQREAAEQVAGATLPLLSSLISKSLVRRQEPGRYDQHELVRQYAAIRLRKNPKEKISARDRHTAYYLAFWREREIELKGAGQREALRELTAEIDNFRAAWEWAITHGRFSILYESLRAFLLLYDLRGWYAEGIERIESIVHALRGTRDGQHELLGLVLALQGWFYFRRGQLKQARERFDQGLRILRPLNDPIALADVLSLSGPPLTALGETAAALEHGREGLAVARGNGDIWRIAYALMMQAGNLVGSGRFDEAYVSAQEALTHFRRLGDTRLIVVTLNTLGFAAMQLSRYPEARGYLQESLSLVTPLEDPWNVGTAYGNLGIVELAQGNPSEARMLLQKSVSLFNDLGMLGDMAFYLTHLGQAAAASGAVDEAEHHWLDALRIAHEARALPTLLANLIRLAQLHADRDDIPRAYKWATFVSSHPASWQDSKNRAEKLRAELGSKLSAGQLESISSSSDEESLDDFVQETLAQPRM